MIPVDEQIKIIMKGVAECIDTEELRAKINHSVETGKPLVVKLGLDPTAPDIHLGHTVVLRKLKQLQDLGHSVVVLIGDFTAKIGDPTGKSKTRKALTTEQVLENAQTYAEQIFKILDREKTQIRFNSEWLSKLGFEDVVRLAANCTVAKMLEREDFKNRYLNNQPIAIHEFFYPLMQAFDSVELQADIELGGTEQRFNILMGRTLQKAYGQESQIAVFMPLLEGIDGKEKMSKSLGNYIGIDEEPNVMFAKTMKIPDSLIIKYFELVTDVHPDEIDVLKARLAGDCNPRDIKMLLAFEIVKLYHGAEAACEAENNFRKVYQKNAVPDDIKKVSLEPNERDIVTVIFKAEFAKSKNAARRLVEQGAVKINGTKVTDIKHEVTDGDIIKVGKDKFCQI